MRVCGWGYLGCEITVAITARSQRGSALVFPGPLPSIHLTLNPWDDTEGEIPPGWAWGLPYNIFVSLEFTASTCRAYRCVNFREPPSSPRKEMSCSLVPKLV